MAMRDLKPFEHPQFRQLLVIVMLWQFTIIGIHFLDEQFSWPINLADPILNPILYLLMFGSCSLWIIWRYRQQGIDVRSLLGPQPFPISWRAILGLWGTLFMFSLGAFQVSYTLVSLLLPDHVETVLQTSLFLGAEETSIPWLHNILFVGILVVGAPILEEFIFRGFLLHRWGTRWNPRIAVILSSVLFGVLHPTNPIGLSAFGLVMALLYLRSRSLGLAIVVHSLNNAIAAGIDIVTRVLQPGQSYSLETFQAGVWLGVMFLLVSTPFLVRFVRQNWRITRTSLPYFAQQDGIP